MESTLTRDDVLVYARRLHGRDSFAEYSCAKLSFLAKTPNKNESCCKRVVTFLKKSPFKKRFAEKEP